MIRGAFSVFVVAVPSTAHLIFNSCLLTQIKQPQIACAFVFSARCLFFEVNAISPHFNHSGGVLRENPALRIFYELIF